MSSSFDRFDQPGPNSQSPLGNVIITSNEDIGSPSRLGRLHRDTLELLTRSYILEAEREDRASIAELVIGASTPRTQLRRIHLDYAGWTASVGPTETGVPRSADETPNPITSLFTAACSIAAVFRLGPWREAEGTDLTPMTYSLLDDSAGGEHPPVPGTLELGTEPLVLFGCGSIAHAFGRAMQGVRVASGALTLVDNGLVAEKNVRKYVGLSSADVGRPKTDTLCGLLEGSGLAIVRRSLSANHFLQAEGSPPALAITCTDTAVSRRDVQSRLPGFAIDAWSGNDPLMLQAGVGWRGFGRGGSCLICNHWTTREPHPDREAAAREYGYTAHELSAAIRENTELPPRQGFGAIERSRFTAEGNLCDEVPAIDGRRQYSVPFVAAAAGAMLALEVTTLGDSNLWPDRRRAPSLRLGIFPSNSCLYADRLAPRPRCICRDETWVEVYRKLWPDPPFGRFATTAIDW